MKIESIIRRKKGTRVTLDDVDYHFTPEVPNGPHVAEVDDEEHIERFLSITEGFREAEDEPLQPDASAGRNVLQGDGAGQAGGNADAKPPAQPRTPKPVKAGKAVVPAKDKAK